MEHSTVGAGADSTVVDAGGNEPTAPSVTAVLAVKSLHRAKSRLAATLSTAFEGDDPVGRGSLVLAMFLDTVDALRGAGISRIVVVSPDDEVLAVARRSGLRGLRESPQRNSPRRDSSPSATADAGLNAAFADGARWAREAWPESTGLMFVQADLPAATSASISAVLHVAHDHPSSFLTDRDGTGTVLLVGTVAGAAGPRFGPGSAAAHRAAGAVELDPSGRNWPDLRTDVDTATDLAVARELGLGAHTIAALRQL
ncbi:2-phospho-L-lactate guanylyltransferase [Gordonia sp. NPDC058843]|uniref:2-phospho-L-lactate guanylyltransferase n=1 Tax=Gordonia sp. NPDC058843 TaxID=3346648 RepID=UPI0036A4380F